MVQLPPPPAMALKRFTHIVGHARDVRVLPTSVSLHGASVYLCRLRSVNGELLAAFSESSFDRTLEPRSVDDRIGI